MIQAIHINSTVPYTMKNLGKAYKIDDFELLTTVLSALMWRKLNGPIKLFTDEIGLEYYTSLNICDLWDAGIDTQVLESVSPNLNQEIFWAAAKIFALQHQQAPVAMIDTDLIVWKNISNILSKQQFAVIHREAINEEYYLPKHLLKKAENYKFDDAWDWTELPCNTSFAYFSNTQFKDYYTKCAIDFMMDNHEYPHEMVSQMVFAEQRIVSMCAKKMNIPIYHFLDDPYQADNSLFTHLWGAKQVARDNNHQRKLLCAALLNKIEELFPEYYEKTTRMLILCKNDAHVVV